MMRPQARSVWTEPRSEGAPRRVRRDWLVVGALLAATVLEVVLVGREVPRLVMLVAGAVVAVSLLWRRTRPLAAVAVAFGTVSLVDVAAIVLATDSPLPWSVAGLLVLPYALFRWGSGREATTGLAIVLAWLAVTHVATPTDPAEIVAGVAFFLLSAALGAAVRFRSAARRRELEQARLDERDQIARELHDTVAHHVSAIAIQAQAGRAVASGDPGRAAEVLQVIEEAATRTLDEMRTMVGRLRNGEPQDLRPQPGIADIARLTNPAADRPRVEVALSGDLDDLSPSTTAALYRLAQESITNAIRHARHATRVDVRIGGDRDSVHLTVRDDGGRRLTGAHRHGYGLVGMTERATLLGGTLRAGPDPEGGWTVTAVLPRGSTRS
jgi:signal transduction histidine kinase